MLVWVLVAAGVLATATVWLRGWWRLPRDRGPERRLAAPLAIASIGAMFVAGAIAASLAPALLSGDPDPDSLESLALRLGGLVLGQLLIGVPVWWLTCGAGSVSNEDDCLADSNRTSMTAAISLRLAGRTRSRAGASVLLGAVSMAVAYPVLASIATAAATLESWLQGVPAELVAHETLSQLAQGGGLESLAGIAVMVLVVTGIPWIEELAYRGLLQPAVGRGLAAFFGSQSESDGHAAASESPPVGRVRWFAIALTSVLFAAMHLPALPEASRWSAVLTLWMVSMVLGWSYERTGRLWAPVAGHGLFNAINLLLTFG